MQITRIPAQRENKKTRIAVYCRVSTKMEEQEDSLETQQAAYTDLISMRSDWELVGIYSDSLSGLSAEKRPEFMRMVNEALEGKIDRILCKSVSRFSRNVAECKKYTDMLKLKNVIVEFEKEHISTADTTSAFLFSLMSAIAENESRSISENVKWSQRERVKRESTTLATTGSSDMIAWTGSWYQTRMLMRFAAFIPSFWKGEASRIFRSTLQILAY